MSSYYIWHNRRGIADQYFIVRRCDSIVICQLPRFIGKWLYDRKQRRNDK